MNIEIITREDLQTLKAEILAEIRQLLGKDKRITEEPWLRSYQVRRLLNVSSGTLQNLRMQGLLTYTKVGGTLFYKREDIDTMLSTTNKKTKSR
ncbi:Helix-turn-helix domain-containing protein [Dyadobacter soli]|uniref:Helix-turn-helix domain-containing protein n=1 Tax=Dyadobacter soli TaxID=659014 RepID=A0A1G7MGR4_9BACT|nr:helix-turn-helix domain-containing protein [Dyadobacter soli]SDF60804.1 Helix-turn-helix domain-containing protein [Dyadobacter soli]